MHIEELLDDIIDTVNYSFKLKLFRKNIVDGEKIVRIATDVKENLPPEFESAKRITENKNRIEETVRAKAESILKNAQDQADVTFSNSQKQADEIIAKAKNEAAQIINDAKYQAEQLVSNHSVTKEAKQRAAALSEETAIKCENLTHETEAKCDKMRADARAWSNNLRDGAYRYAIALINDVEGYIAETSHGLNDLRIKVEKNAPTE